MSLTDMASSYRIKNGSLYMQIAEESLETYNLRLREERKSGPKCFAVNFRRKASLTYSARLHRKSADSCICGSIGSSVLIRANHSGAFRSRYCRSKLFCNRVVLRPQVPKGTQAAIL